MCGAKTALIYVYIVLIGSKTGQPAKWNVATVMHCALLGGPAQLEMCRWSIYSHTRGISKKVGHGGTKFSPVDCLS